VEFHRRHEILNKYGSEGITGFVETSLQSSSGRESHPAGTFSDDTQMALAVARALIDEGKSEVESLMRSMGNFFVEWSRSPENNRAPGRTCLQGCENLSRGVVWRKAGIRNSKGCGSAMRVAPIGLFFWRDPRRLLEVARASSLLTHGHDAAIEGAAAAALMVALAMEKKTPRQTYDTLMRECAPHSEDLRKCLEKIPGLLDAETDQVLSSAGLGEGWVAEEAVASALYCHWKFPWDFKKAVLMAANTDGDSDSIACITGSVSGALNGADSIPQKWRATVEKSEDLVETARELLQASDSGCR
jgi:ADP-ribosylglycohydrolase